MAPIQIIVRHYYYEIMKLMQLALTAAKCAQRAGPARHGLRQYSQREEEEVEEEAEGEIYCKQMLTLAACVKIMSIEKSLISRKYEWGIAGHSEA